MKNNTPRILLLMGTSHGYGRDLIDGISQYLYEFGCRVDFDFRGHREEIPSWVKDWRGDGIIVRHHLSSTFRLLDKMKIPYVKLNCDCKEVSPSDVDVDEEAICEMALSHFCERGLEHFAYFAECDQYWTQKRAEAFIHTVKKRGANPFVHIASAETIIPFNTWKPAEKKRLIHWLRDLPKPIGLLTAYDMHAKLILDICEEEGIAIPNEIAVLGINNEEWFCRIQRHPLSSIIQNAREAGYQAAKLICEKIEGKNIDSQPILIPPISVFARRSTDLIAVQDEDLVAAFRMIRENWGIGISIEDLVQEIGLSRRTLERKFRKQFGKSIGEEIIRLRMERARELLRETNLPIGNIARKLGFCSHSYFVHAFCKQTKETPGEYRIHFR